MILPGERVSLGDIPSGSSRVREFPLAAAATDGRAAQWDLREIRFNDPMRDLLLRNSYFPQEQGRAVGAALFFGWVQGGPRGVSVEDERVRAREFTLFRARFPLGEEEE